MLLVKPLWLLQLNMPESSAKIFLLSIIYMCKKDMCNKDIHMCHENINKYNKNIYMCKKNIYMFYLLLKEYQGGKTSSSSWSPNLGEISLTT